MKYEVLRKKLNALEITKFEIYDPDKAYSKNDYEAIKILITFDLDGFEKRTLLDMPYFNLLNCKQIHILQHPNADKEKYLTDPLSISMFFLCTDREYGEYLKSRYPYLPYLKIMQNIEKADSKCSENYSEILAAEIKRIIEENHL